MKLFTFSFVFIKVLFLVQGDSIGRVTNEEIFDEVTSGESNGTNFKEEITGKIEELSNDYGLFGDYSNSFLNSTVNATQILTNNTAENVNSFADRAAEMASNAWDKTSEFAKDAASKTREFFSSAFDSVKKFGNGALEAGRDAANKAKEFAKKTFGKDSSNKSNSTLNIDGNITVETDASDIFR